MKKAISIGIQGFSDLREQDCFFVDKTNFIKEWWGKRDVVTLITRPRRFGKTLNMSMLNCFFSRQYEHRGDLFEGLNIWSDLKYRNTGNPFGNHLYLSDIFCQSAALTPQFDLSHNSDTTP